VSVPGLPVDVVVVVAVVVLVLLPGGHLIAALAAPEQVQPAEVETRTIFIHMGETF